MFPPIDVNQITPFSAAVAAIAVILTTILLYWRKNRGLPPGPTGVPFLGYYPFMQDEYHLQMRELAKKYGDVFTFSVTGQKYIHLNSLKVLREAFVTKAESFGHRGYRYSIINHCYGKGMALEEGERWKVLRKFYVQNLKEFGASSLKGNMAEPVYDSLKAVTEEFSKSGGAPFDAVTLMTKYCTTTAEQLLFCGVEIPKEDLETLNAAYLDMLNAMRGTRLLLSGPIAKYIILPFSSGTREMKIGKKIVDSILRKIVEMHKSTLNDDQPRDLVDCYITERNIRTRKGDPTASYFTDEGLAATFIQLLGDGALTIGYFVAAFLNALVKHPDVQEKIYSELLDVVGPDRQPTFEDKSKLPYTNAAITEMLRATDFSPIFPSLICTKETTLNGYRIPEGYMTVINFYSILHDPELYKDPDTFDPTRFISTPGKPKEESPVTFGVGKRACPGEPFTMMEVFLFLVTIVKNFKLVPPPESDNSAPEVSPLNADISIKICALPRSEE